MAVRTFLSWMVAFVAVMAGSPATARLSPTSGPKSVGILACLASPEKTLAWWEKTRVQASRLGVDPKGMSGVGEELKSLLGANLFSAAGWKDAGLDVRAPICLMGPVTRHGDIVFSFAVSDEARAREFLVRVLELIESSDWMTMTFKATPAKVGKSKGWKFAGYQKDSKLKGKDPESEYFLVVKDGTGFFARKAADLEFLSGPVEDLSPSLAIPEGDVVIVGNVDVTAIGSVTGEKEISGFATAWVPRGRFSFVVAQDQVRARVEATNGGLMTLVAGAIGKAGSTPEQRIRALNWVGEDAAGFTQIDLPLAAILEAVKTAGGLDAKNLLPGPIADVFGSLRGDLTFTLVDGMTGLTLLASLNDAGRFDKGLTGILSMTKEGGTHVTDSTETLAGTTVRVLRFGDEDSWFRFPVYVAVRDGMLFATLTRSRMADALEKPSRNYLDSLDDPSVRETLKADALMVSHGWVADLLGDFAAHEAFLRGALSSDAIGWLDLFSLPSLAGVLAYDSTVVAQMTPETTSFEMRLRFLKADPDASDSREKAFAQALRIRSQGRTGAWRQALIDIQAGNSNDSYGRKAKRILLTAGMLSDEVLFLSLGTMAIAVMGFRSHASDVPGEIAMPKQTPCEEYLMEACMGGDPESADCKDARKYYDTDGGVPSDKDQEECTRKLTAIAGKKKGDK